MAPHDVFSYLATLRREQDFFARAMLDESVAFHALQRGRHGRRRDVETFGEPRSNDGATVAGQVVQDLQIVLDDRRRCFAAVDLRAHPHAAKYRADALGRPVLTPAIQIVTRGITGGAVANRRWIATPRRRMPSCN